MEKNISYTEDIDYSMYLYDDGYSPEKRLYAAVLIRAILDLTISDLHERKLSKLWFYGEIKNSFFTFTDICQILNLDPYCVIKSLKKRKLLS